MPQKKSPAKSPADYLLGTVETGRDGNEWVVLEKEDGSKKWKRLYGETNEYKIIDNGSEPFLVVTSDKLILIYRQNGWGDEDEGEDMDEPYYEFLMSIDKFTKVFIGESREINADGPGLYTGNSILIEIDELTYICIGYVIEQFKTMEPVLSYYSIMGNSAVPYPYALTKSYAYFLIDNVYIDLIEGDDEDSPYGRYWTPIPAESFKFETEVLHESRRQRAASRRTCGTRVLRLQRRVTVSAACDARSSTPSQRPATPVRARARSLRPSRSGVRRTTKRCWRSVPLAG